MKGSISSVVDVIDMHVVNFKSSVLTVCLYPGFLPHDQPEYPLDLYIMSRYIKKLN